ncbi:MAG: cobaltochelatase subunit CobN [Armatimonadetes bacterium]|nr:cobaltochelatase subunit CobN [Armatimonadota bacterium]
MSRKIISILTLGILLAVCCLPALAGENAASPSRAAYQKGKGLAETVVAGIYNQQGYFPQKVAALVWCGETARDEGVMASFVLNLLGVQPAWDQEGKIKGLELIPARELARPRLDVVIIISGLFRDNYAPTVVLMDRACKMALAASYHEITRNHPELKSALEAALFAPNMAGLSAKGEEPLEQNFLAGHWVKLTKEYLAAGKSPGVAGRLAVARIFGPPVDGYGAGISQQIKKDRIELASLYPEQLGHSYGEDTWGEENVLLFQEHLKDIEFAFHSRNTELYGLLDNAVSYDYGGGLLLSLERLNQGKQAKLFVLSEAAPSGQIQTLAEYLIGELRTKYFNPRWIEANFEKSFGFITNLWGWQVTSPQAVQEWMWQAAYDTYLQDRHGLDTRQKIIQVNPCLLIRFVGTLVAASQKGYWHPDQAALKELATSWLQLTAAYGEKCSWYQENLEITNWARSYLEKATPPAPETEEAGGPAPKAALKVRKPGEAPAPDKKSQGPAGGERKAEKQKTPERKAYEVEVAQPAGLAKIHPALLPVIGIVILIIARTVKYFGGRVKRQA